jgi:hypothetical protein
MAPHTRAEIVAEITELRKQQLEDGAEALFGGLTREQEDAHRERADRLARLVHELDTLDEITRRAHRVT